MSGVRPVVVLDANVLYPARLRDLFLRLAIAGYYSARWTDAILDECFDNLMADRPDLSAIQLDRTRQLMGLAIPDALVSDYEETVERLDLPDPGDRHVLAAALTADADLLVTRDVADFPLEASAGGHLSVVTPDEFLLYLVEADAAGVLAIVGEQAANLRNPPMTLEEVLDGLEQVGLKTGWPLSVRSLEAETDRRGGTPWVRQSHLTSSHDAI